MFPLLDIEKAQKPNNKMFDKNTSIAEEVEGDSFSDILNLNMNKTDKKSSKKDKNTTAREEITDKKDLIKDKKSKNDDKEIKESEIDIKLDKVTIDKLKGKKDTNIQNKLEVKTKDIINTKEISEIKLKGKKEIMLPKNEKELLEFTKQIKIESKRTIKDIVDEANNLKLNVKKADIQIHNKNIHNKNKDVINELKHDLLRESATKNIALKQDKEVFIKDSKITPKKETNILNSILQDKELIAKTNEDKGFKKPEPKKSVKHEVDLEVKNKKPDSKEIKNIDVKEARVTENKEVTKHKAERQTINLETQKLEIKQDNKSKSIKDEKANTKQTKVEIRNEAKVDIKNNNVTNKKVKNDSIKDESKVNTSYQQEIRLTNIIKEEIINPISFKENVKETKETDYFLSNLLKTESNVKPQEEVVSQNKVKEKVKEKVTNENYQGNIQSQKHDNFVIKNTFLNFGDKLRETLQQYKPPITKISLELNPEKLGSVELTITKRGDNINVQISSNSQALKMFMQNKEEFKKELSSLGFNDVVLDFKDIEGNSLFGGFGDSNPNQHNQNQQNREDNQKRNENGLQAYKEADESSLEVYSIDLSFSYYA